MVPGHFGCPATGHSVKILVFHKLNDLGQRHTQGMPEVRIRFLQICGIPVISRDVFQYLLEIHDMIPEFSRCFEVKLRSGFFHFLFYVAYHLREFCFIHR